MSLNNGIITQLNKDADTGQAISILMPPEQKQIYKNMILLNQIPDLQQSFILSNDILSNGDSFVRIRIDQAITNPNQFKVDDRSGREGTVYFHSSLEGKTITITKYYGKGNVLIDASRVVTDYTNNEVKETLADLTDNVRTQANYGKSQGDYAKTEGDYAKQQGDLANTATTNANNAVANINNETLMIYKPYVNTYADIATTYSTPQNGWETVVKDTNTRYRYNSTLTQWVAIDPAPYDKIGDLTQLNTIAKDNLVNSIKENTNKIGNLSTLNTQNKTDLAGAINENVASLNDITTVELPLPNSIRHINKFGIKQNPFLTFRRALLKPDVINVTFWGDSITTNGDKLNVNSATPSGSDYAPNGIINSESYTNIITNSIAKSFPNSKFNFYNRAIGGTTLLEWNYSKTINGVTKTWIEHVKDTAPDLLFIGFGMNHNRYSSSVAYASSLKNMIDYINTNFTKIPDIVLVTSPTCVFIEGNTTWSDDRNQESRRNSGKEARYYGIQYVDYVLDVGRYSDISRFGKDLENIYFEEKTGFSKTGSTSLKNNGDSLVINEKCRDFTIQLTLSVSSITDGEYLLLTFNEATDETKSVNNQLAIFPNQAGVLKMHSYGRIVDYTNFPTYNTGNYTHGTALSAMYLRIEKRGNILKVLLGDVPENLVIYDTCFDLNNVKGTISLTKKGGSTSTMNISNLRYFEAKYHEYKPIITEMEMFGTYVDGVYNTDAITGGNGANHPASKGITKVYGTPIAEMIADICALSKHQSDVDLMMERQDIAFTADAVSLSGYCFGTVSNILFLQGCVTNADGSVKLKQNRKCTSPSLRTVLADGEFGIYVTGGVIQIIFKNTMGATGYSTPFKFNTYQFI